LLADQESVTEGCADCTPEPDREIVREEFDALLETTMSPLELDDAVGAKTTVREADFPAASDSPGSIPVAAKPVPDSFTAETETLEVPAFRIDTVLLVEEPTSTLPKARFAGVALNTPAAATPVPLRVSFTEPSVVVANVAAPEMLAVDCGVKCTVNVTLFPLVIVSGVARPVTLKSASDVATFEITRLDVPVFFKVPFCVAAEPTRTLEKATDFGIRERACGIPIPLSKTLVAEEDTLVKMLRLPPTQPATLGVNEMATEILLPGSSVFGRFMPPMEKPAPETVALEMTRAALPVLLIVSVLLTDKVR
jgi:hypothetical protein